MKKTILFFIFLFGLVFAYAQMGFSIPADSGKVEVPFKRSNNLIIIPLTFNNEVTLEFILDSSVEYSILTDKTIGDAFGMNYLRRISLGSVNGEPSYGHAANGIKLSIGAATTQENHAMLVLDYDFMNLSNLARTRVYGVIGYDLLGSLVVKIDNSKNKLILYPKEGYDAPRGYDALPLTLKARKAFISTDITFENWDKEMKTFQIKTGATHTILFNSDSNLFHLPSHKLEIPLGIGPSGPIEGYVGRVREMSIASFMFEDIIASFTKNEVGSNKETGSIGMGVLSRFDVIFDYSGSKMYLKRNKNFSNTFEYDLSGLKIDSNPDNPDIFEVSHLINNSPASKAGINVGDRILSIQGEKLTNENSNRLLGSFLRKAGRKIRVQIQRDDEVIETSFTLVSMI